MLLQSSASLAELQNGIGKMDISPTENGAGADSAHGRTVTGTGACGVQPVMSWKTSAALHRRERMRNPNHTAASFPYNMSCAGVLSSRPTSRDIKIDGFSMGLNGVELIQDCSIELTIGRRYGLIGQNGCGKTNFLQCLASREVGFCDVI